MKALAPLLTVLLALPASAEVPVSLVAELKSGVVNI